MPVLEALTLNGNAKPYVAFAHKRMDYNNRTPFTPFEESYERFTKTVALDEPTNTNFSLQNFI